MRLAVSGAEKIAAGVRSIGLRDPEGRTLRSFTPGSHLVVECGGRRNAYSLTGPLIEPAEYRISVLCCPKGSGGSMWLHDLAVGDEVIVSSPRSAFAPVATARHHLLIAGGIGITPLLSHARAARDWGCSFALLYGYRPGAGAHLRELREICGPALTEFQQRTDFQERLHAVLREQPLGTHLYACGPAGLLDFVTETARNGGWPHERVHVERFAAADLDPGNPFTATLSRSGTRIAVPAGVSLLDALEAAGVAVPNMCRQGVCGECRTGVRSGRPHHRDLYLSEQERAAGDAVMCCVSRSLDEELELDL